MMTPYVLNLTIQGLLRNVSARDFYDLYSKEEFNNKIKLLTRLAKDDFSGLFPFEKDSVLNELKGILRCIIQLKNPKNKEIGDPIINDLKSLDLINSSTKKFLEGLLKNWQSYEQEQTKLKRAEKEKKFDAFANKGHVDRVLSQEAYQQAKKAILIGGMASGSRPYSSKEEDKDRMPSEDLKKAVTSIARKHEPKFDELKARYKEVWREKSPLRVAYSGADNASRGALYSQLRVEKYMDRPGMKSAIIQHIGLELHLDKVEDINKLMHDAQEKFKNELHNLNTLQSLLPGNSKKQAAMMACLAMLAEAFQTLPIGKMSEGNKIIQTIAMMEITQIFNKLQNKTNTLLLADYYQAMALLNVALIERLELIPDDDRSKENFFKDIVALHLRPEDATKQQVSETLVGNSCTEVLGKSLIALGMDDKTEQDGNKQLKLKEPGLPGFPLEGVRPGTVRHGYFVFNSQSGVNKKQVQPSDTCALIGRDTDTLYSLDVASVAFKKTIEDMEFWARSDPKPKTLVVDLTVPTIEPETILNATLDMRNKLSSENSFDILLVRSEQKQQTLGTGKFAAGSACLITNNAERLERFNQEAKKLRTTDQKLASFYRENVSKAVIALVEAQVESARKYVERRPAEELIANGPLVFSKNRDYKTNLSKGASFGFFVESASQYTDVTRIDPGLGEDEEPPSPAPIQ